LAYYFSSFWVQGHGHIGRLIRGFLSLMKNKKFLFTFIKIKIHAAHLEPLDLRIMSINLVI